MPGCGANFPSLENCTCSPVRLIVLVERLSSHFLFHDTKEANSLIQMPQTVIAQTLTGKGETFRSQCEPLQIAHLSFREASERPHQFSFCSATLRDLASLLSRVDFAVV